MLDRRRILTLLVAAAAAGCGGFGSAEDAAVNDGAGSFGGNTGVGQSGSQDFGRFRDIIEDGEVPAPEMIDPVGFFNEHKIELPDPDCGEDVCLHGLLGVQGNMINGNNCTIMLAGFNTPLDPDDFERPPLNMAIAVDVSGSMQGTPMESVRAGLLSLAGQLDPKDTVTLVTYSSEAQIAIDSTPEEDPERAQLLQAIDALQANGGTNIYDGLRTALEAVEQRRSDARQNRVILLSDGVATAGITDRDRLVNLGHTYASNGVGITTIGVGDEFDLPLMSQLAEQGSGNFYFLEDAGAVEEVFSEEIKTFLVPLAVDVRLSLRTTEPYSFRAAYGTNLWSGDSGGVDIEIPALFIASRETSDDIGPGGGRRGGGGAILLELVPTADRQLASEWGAGNETGTITLEYRKPGSDQVVRQSVTVINQLQPGEIPAEGEFDSPAVEKAFVALNIFAGFEMAVERVDIGAPNAALNVLNPLLESVEEWLTDNEDPDIDDDRRVLQQLITNIEEQGATEELGASPDPWPQGD